MWTASAARRRTRASWPHAAAALRAAERPLIVAGGGVLYCRGRAGAGRLRRAARPPGRPRPRPARARWPGTIRATSASIGVTGIERRQRAGGRRRRRAGGRHAAAGLHHRLAGPVREPGARAGPGQRRRLRRRQARRAAAGRRRAARPRGAVRARSGDWTAPSRAARRAHDGAQRWRGRRRTRDRGAAATPPALRRPGDRRGQARGRRRRASWSAPPAACRASCTSCGAPRARRLPRRIRLFLHGLRDRRRRWASSWPRRTARSS